MATAHPARNKRCVFCNRWTGEANLKMIAPNIGYEFTTAAMGKCAKNNATRPSHWIADKCEHYDPNMDARRML